MHEAIRVACAECGAQLASLDNSWVRIGRTYLVPESQKEHDIKLVMTGPVRPGVEDTLVSECMLQDADCTSCGTYLGQYCISSPPDHPVRKGQAIFRAKAIRLDQSSDDQLDVTPIITRTLALKLDKTEAPTDKEAEDAAAPSSPSPSEEFNVWASTQSDQFTDESVDLSQLQADVDTQREELHQLTATGLQAVTSFEGAMTRIEQKVQQMNDLMEVVQRDGQERVDHVSENTATKEELAQITTKTLSLEQGKADCSTVSQLEAQVEVQVEAQGSVNLEMKESLAQFDGIKDDWVKTQEELQEAKAENARLRQDIDDMRRSTDERFAAMNNCISGVPTLQQDIDEIKESTDERFMAMKESVAGVSALQQEMDEMKKSTDERFGVMNESVAGVPALQQELDEMKRSTEEQFVVMNGSIAGVPTLRQDFQQLQQELAAERADTATADSISQLYHELDILSRHVSKTCNRANQIESLQMDVELFRLRLQKVEGMSHPKQTPGKTDLRSLDVADDEQEDELSHEPVAATIGQKRAAPDSDNPEFLGTTPPKRRAIVSDDSSPTSNMSFSATDSSPTSMPRMRGSPFAA